PHPVRGADPDGPPADDEARAPHSTGTAHSTGPAPCPSVDHRRAAPQTPTPRSPDALPTPTTMCCRRRRRRPTGVRTP
ncbi:hypothetical protein ACFU6S_41455, partial [Streptomyces sp. NPDC057456]